jgi:hypothetical protein
LAASRTIVGKIWLALLAWALVFAPQAQSVMGARAPIDLVAGWTLCSHDDGGAPASPQGPARAGHACCDLCCLASAALIPPPPWKPLGPRDRLVTTLAVQVDETAPVLSYRARSGESRAPPSRRLG